MLESWLRPLSVAELPSDKPGTIGGQITTYTHTLPDMTGSRIALIGADPVVADAVRKALYPMAFHFRGLKLTDLGNARKQDANFLAPLLQELVDQQIIPVLIGSSAGSSLAHYYAHKVLKSSVNLAIIDRSIPYLASQAFSEKNYLKKIFEPARGSQLHCSWIGFQTHYVSPETLHFIEQSGYDTMRLGKAREDFQEMEPLLRAADYLSFHLNAIKFSDAPGQDTPSPNGFFGEEACQICRYAGLSESLKSFGIFGYNPSEDVRRQTAHLLAQMIWYFVEGVFNRQDDYPVSNTGLVEYLVNFKDHDFEISFWKSSRTGRWWMEIPVTARNHKMQHAMIPCTMADYQKACGGELPERLWKAIQKYQ